MKFVLALILFSMSVTSFAKTVAVSNQRDREQPVVDLFSTDKAECDERVKGYMAGYESDGYIALGGECVAIPEKSLERFVTEDGDQWLFLGHIKIWR